MPRPLDGDNTGTASVDIGCYEYCQALADSDGDGMPDGWEMNHGLSPIVSDATGNPDNDEQNNRQEYVADTDPTNAASCFHITAVSNVPPWRTYFLSSTARVYALEGSANLLLSNQWSVVGAESNKTGNGGVFWLSDTNAAATGRFYRIRVQLP